MHRRDRETHSLSARASANLAMLACLWGLTGIAVPVLAAPGDPAPADTKEVSPKDPTVPPAKDCHGPLYYKMKSDDIKNRTIDHARRMTVGFASQMGRLLEVRTRSDYERRSEARFESFKTCLQEQRKPPVVAVALTRGEPEMCDYALSRAEQFWCPFFIALGKALPRKSAAPCEALPRPDQVELCRQIVEDRLDCSIPGLTLSERELCRQLRETRDSGNLVLGPLPEINIVIRFILALEGHTLSWCQEGMPEKYRQTCEAMIRGNTQQMDRRRPGIELVDRDFSCRYLVLDIDRRTEPQGTEVVLHTDGSFALEGHCDVFLDIAASGGQLRRKVATIDPILPGHQRIRSILGPGETLMDASEDCLFDNPKPHLQPTPQDLIQRFWW